MSRGFRSGPGSVPTRSRRRDPDRVLTMDLHSPQIQGFFRIPVDHLYARHTICDHVRTMEIPDLVVAVPTPVLPRMRLITHDFSTFRLSSAASNGLATTNRRRCWRSLVMSRTKTFWWSMILRLRWFPGQPRGGAKTAWGT
ncbi:MAG: hypothetical protein CM1200mP2_11340 [Planctomycetaceae bacterium]|nr:MAG: hypothetical protein CM1200mP2_11340 [Planctomycetaceae bacterium]